MGTEFDQSATGDELQERSSQRRPRILVVDDDETLVELLCETLKNRGFDSLVARDGNRAIEIIEGGHVDLVILDLAIPGKDGFEVLEQVRRFSRTPIIVLSARHESEVKVRCLELGADDYVTKPFSVKELYARCEAVLRRYEGNASAPSVTAFDDRHLTIDFDTRRVTLDGEELALTKTEYDLLRELAVNAGKPLTYRELLHRVWGPDYRDETQYVHVYVNRLRRKIEADPLHRRYLVTHPGVGYQFKASE
jgi:two-component system KDP operon response regulator KdpE